ncbi:glycine-rich domain-containing protein-like [Oxalobacteraceae sp. CFBP 13730]|nr:glycine-rich domain-containing protein-like [Oxalobacteraceae sp. CFBP 13730]
MSTHTEYAAFEALDLNPIKMKLMHAASGEGWSETRTNAVETEYRRFLFLMKKYPDAGASPSVDVDTFWHYHILDTMKYARDCEAVFGFFLHHYPYVGIAAGTEGEHVQAGERMRQLYEAEFGVVVRGDAAFCASPGKPAGASAFCASPGKPAGVSAFCASPGKPATAARAITFCASPGKPAAKVADSAFCASPGLPAIMTSNIAFCASPGKRA